MLNATTAATEIAQTLENAMQNCIRLNVKNTNIVNAPLMGDVSPYGEMHQVNGLTVPVIRLPYDHDGVVEILDQDFLLHSDDVGEYVLTSFGVSPDGEVGLFTIEKPEEISASELETAYNCLQTGILQEMLKQQGVEMSSGQEHLTLKVNGGELTIGGNVLPIVLNGVLCLVVSEG